MEAAKLGNSSRLWLQGGSNLLFAIMLGSTCYSVNNTEFLWSMCCFVFDLFTTECLLRMHYWCLFFFFFPPLNAMLQSSTGWTVASTCIKMGACAPKAVCTSSLRSQEFNCPNSLNFSCTPTAINVQIQCKISHAQPTVLHQNSGLFREGKHGRGKSSKLPKANS